MKRTMVDLSIDLGFLRLKNPVIAASGTFGYGSEYTPFIDLNLLGGFVTKGLYYNSREGNPPPRLVETASGLINAIGLPGIGIKKFTESILPKLKTYHTALIVNVCGESEDEYCAVAEHLNRHDGITAYELNISCPNVEKNGACPGLSPDETYRIVSRFRRVSKRPVITKLSPNVTDITAIALSAQDAGTDAVSLVNTYLALAVDALTRKPKLTNVFGGLSGPAIKPLALRQVYQAAQSIKIPVIGMGGIFSGQDALEFMIAGASAVEVGTANFIDPEATVSIINEIKTFCHENSIKKLQDIIGTLDT